VVSEFRHVNVKNISQKMTLVLKSALPIPFIESTLVNESDFLSVNQPACDFCPVKLMIVPMRVLRM
jgi:hypothetical protein